MKWLELTIVTNETATEMVAHYLHELGAGGVSIEESGTLSKQRNTSLGEWYDKPLNDIPEGKAEVKSYFDPNMNSEELLRKLQEQVAELPEFGVDVGDITYSLAFVDDEDWANAWKQYFKPMRVTDKLTIKPTWEIYESEADEIILEIDPGMAFGTGTHPTTTLCLRALEESIAGGEQVVDVGTGSGILAIGACLLGADKVLALDLDPIAVTSATENAELNNLSDRIQAIQSDLLSVLGGKGIFAPGEAPVVWDKVDAELTANAVQVALPADIVVANILADIILQFVDEVYAALKPGGLYITSGIYENKEELTEQGLIAAGFEVVRKYREEKWIAFVCRRPNEPVTLPEQ